MRLATFAVLPALLPALLFAQPTLAKQAKSKQASIAP